MLNSLKEKWLQSTKNHDELPHMTSNNQLPLLSPNRINAGGKILKHFQEQWSELHSLNENNAKNLRITADMAKHIYTETEKQKQNFTVLNNWVLSLPMLSKSLNHCVECLSDMYVVCDKVEGKFIELEDLIEEFQIKCKDDLEQKILGICV